MVTRSSKNNISPIASGVQGRCPRCGVGKLFDGYLTPAKKCNMCELDFKFMDSGDGPAVFVILIAGFVVCALALIVEVSYTPPYWVHGVLWLPLGLILPLLLLRPFKGVLLNLQYHHDARPGRRK